MSARAALHLKLSAFGLLFGFTISRAGFTRYGELHKMFVFSDPRLFLTFCGAVALCVVGLAALRANQKLPPRPFHPGMIVGGTLFGLGWAICGACPGAALAQIGQGDLCALWSLSGILAGTWLYRVFVKPKVKWEAPGCGL